MTEYTIKLTDNAIRQLQETTLYIARELQSPETAKRWMESMQAEIASLSSMPKRIPLTDKEPWRSRGIHKMTVKHFLVYFWIDEKTTTVWVTAVVYGRRDQRTILETMPLD